MKAIFLSGAAALAVSACAFAGETTIADRCMAHFTKGAVTTFRDVDTLASGRDRIAYFRCVRGGLRDDVGMSALAGLTPSVTAVIGGSGSGFSAFNISL
jgi:hypothetical protein